MRRYEKTEISKIDQTQLKLDFFLSKEGSEVSIYVVLINC